MWFSGKQVENMRYTDDNYDENKKLIAVFVDSLSLCELVHASNVDRIWLNRIAVFKMDCNLVFLITKTICI